MAVLAELQDESRSAERHDLGTDTTLRVADRPIDILIVNLSATGCLFICSKQIQVGADVTIGIPGRGRCKARIVRNEREKYGCVFTTPLSGADLAGAFGGDHDNLLLFPYPESSADDADVPADRAEMLSPRSRLLLLGSLVTVLWTALLLSALGLF